jgi:transposase-like protein
MEHNPKSFIPEHCPNSKCKHHKGFKDKSAWKRAGYFWKHNRKIRIQRFTCLHCGRSFSTQTFSTDYWQRKQGMGKKIFFKVVGCMANRQIARDLGVAPSTVDRHVSRLARHCILFHMMMIAGLKAPSQIVVDGFESFEWSQYFPINLNIAIEKGTDFFFYFTDSEMPRKGSMTQEQRRRREELERELGRPDPKAIEKGMKELLEVTLEGQDQATVFSDYHQAYPRAIRQLDCQIKHLKTPGKEHRDKNNNLWEVNLVDLLIRHTSSNHKRETLAWSKRRQGAAERLVIFLVMRNYVQRRREKDRASPTPAMEKGLTTEPLTPDGILDGRLFRTQAELPPRWAQYYDRMVETRALDTNTRHELKYNY